MHARPLIGLAVLALDLAACSHSEPVPTPTEPPAPAAAPAPVAAKPTFDKLPRLEFNRRAAERYQPLFWRSDANKNGALDPDELAFLWGYGELKREALIGKDGFTDAFGKLYATLLAPDDKAPSAEEQKRRDAIKLELAQGRATLLETDLTTASAQDKAIAEHL